MINLIIAALVYLGFFFFLRSYHQKHFRAAALENMFTGTSPYRPLAADPCDKGFANDPHNFSQRYVKLNIYCSPTHKTSNTIILDTLKEQTVSTVFC